MLLWVFAHYSTVNRRLARFNDSFRKFALGSTAMRGDFLGGSDATDVVGILGEMDREKEGQKRGERAAH